MRRGGRPQKGKWVGVLVIIGFVAFVVGMIVWDFNRKADVGEARARFFDPLHAGDLDAAYAELSAERRAVMSRKEFEAFISHPVFLDPNVSWYLPEPDAPGWCIDGYVRRKDGEWAIQVFLLEEDDELRMHALALQRPARVQLSSLVAPCGYWKGTLIGYNGPLPGPSTETTRSRW